jgi:hypothetical protein
MERRYHINMFWSASRPLPGLPTYPDLKHCSAHGETPEQALAEVQVAMSLWIAVGGGAWRRSAGRADIRPADLRRSFCCLTLDDPGAHVPCNKGSEARVEAAMWRALKFLGVGLLFLVVGLCLAIISVPPFLDRIYYRGPRQRILTASASSTRTAALARERPPRLLGRAHAPLLHRTRQDAMAGVGRGHPRLSPGLGDPLPALARRRRARGVEPLHAL